MTKARYFTNMADVNPSDEVKWKVLSTDKYVTVDSF